MADFFNRDLKQSAQDAGEALAKKATTTGVDGAAPFKGARAIATEALDHTGGDREQAIARVVRLHTTLAGVEGFATGLPGGLAVVAAIPADITAFYLLAARMVACVAHLRNYDVNDDEVRTAILLALLGSGANEVVKEFGVEVGQKGLAAAVKKIPGAVFIGINKKVGFRLITKAGEKGVINVGKLVPFVGGPIGGGVNVFSMNRIGAAAKKHFPALPPNAGPDQNATELAPV